MKIPPEAAAARHSWPARLRRTAAWSGFVVLGTAGSWFGTLALLPWHLGYTYDPATGVEHGPPVPWQFLVCGVLLLGIAVVTSWNRYWPTVLLLPPSLTLAWSVTASNEDITGLWLVGAGFMAIGSVMGTLVVLGITRFARPEHALPKSPFDGGASVSGLD
ncbi:hypothetical protein I2485_04445 [Nesterenkonia sp. E16_7]|uniref:hypothetical protein n=1 Tax=unclassified Nesterenkonia TaxID=2629769 RepID=UPI001A939B1E|nr:MULTISPECIES: hypothetical protein [unclassified Nesterenkonia]MBO0596712.1 hypothetical protein [Nesterenkonia sp. E16_10]MBO0597894.1 hypothetical protein [Nesterenkonia sp. E16_7]